MNNSSQVREAASRQPHKLEMAGSTPAPASKTYAGAGEDKSKSASAKL